MRPKTTTKKTVSKPCSECDRQVPVACKTCPCGYSFYTKRGDSNTGSGTEGTDPGSPATPRSACSSSVDISPGGRRRTERVKRERPNYFNALEFVSPTSRRRRTISASQSSGTDEPQKKKRGRPRTNFKSRDDQEGGKTIDSLPCQRLTPMVLRKRISYVPRNDLSLLVEQQLIFILTEILAPVPVVYRKPKQSSADKEVDAYAGVPIEKVMQYAIVLAEINRKYSMQTFRP